MCMRLNHEQYLKRVKENNSKVIVIGEYKSAHEKIRAKCKECGYEWDVQACSLIQGRACPKCKVKRTVENNKGKTKKKTQNEFVSELNKIDSSIKVISNYISHHDFVKCECERCGNIWEAKAYSLLQGHGCPRCAKSGTSFMEQFIRLSFINALSEKDVISRDRKLIGMEIDILIPRLRIAIEPGNWFLHKKSIKRDEKKRELCKGKDYKLITIYDKFPKNELKPFKENCIVFNDDYNKADRKEIKKLVKELFKLSNIECNFNKETWKNIEEQAYDLAKSKTHEEFIKEMEDRLPDIKVIGKYENANRRILVECKKCGFQWKGVPANLIRGDGCRKCGTIKAHEKFLKDKKELIKELKTKNPDVEIIGEYTGRHNPIKAKCKICGYEWEPIVSSLLRGSSHKGSRAIHK